MGRPVRDVRRPRVSGRQPDPALRRSLAARIGRCGRKRATWEQSMRERAKHVRAMHERAKRDNATARSFFATVPAVRSRSTVGLYCRAARERASCEVGRHHGAIKDHMGCLAGPNCKTAAHMKCLGLDKARSGVATPRQSLPYARAGSGRRRWPTVMADGGRCRSGIGVLSLASRGLRTRH